MAPLAELKEAVRGACDHFLQNEPNFALAREIPPAEICFEGLAQRGAAFAEEWAARLAGSGFDAAEVGRCVLVRAAVAALELVSQQRVADSVKRLLLDDFAKLIDPPARWQPMFVPSTMRYQEMLKLTVFQRFPAGQLQWETISWFPGSFVVAAGLRGGLRLAACLTHIGARGPMWEVHLNDRRPNAFLLSEKAARKSYFRMAKSLELQPGIKAITVGSWLYSKEIAEVSPHLAWLRRHFEENGATVADLGPAPADSGFLTGDANRKALFESGSFRPRLTVAIWPRSAVLQWAGKNQDLGD